MSKAREAIVEIWDKLNPSEPSPWYLAKLMGFIILSCIAALLIGGHI